ncbi:GRAM domain-containing protein 2A isoform X4 [Hippopotamus amphibius kiboko]|uniref:GRAM domain-containing protein 2A isoform X3 n=2 Tax=Hippopotamus amphibius kiboko TaxID=575201 RepID=UPI0025936841|nr:GRAM domain-containing protein 2A isoform X3 [Hippopotamus amphibius kiboko]XP_057579179.1 GRAM domain-containing protein 2A isoform X4 [Hippopotamus amphibius kiboko]
MVWLSGPSYPDGPKASRPLPGVGQPRPLSPYLLVGGRSCPHLCCISCSALTTSPVLRILSQKLTVYGNPAWAPLNFCFRSRASLRVLPPSCLLEGGAGGLTTAWDNSIPRHKPDFVLPAKTQPTDAWKDSSEEHGETRQGPETPRLQSCRPRGGGCKEGSSAGIMARGQALEPLHWPEGLKGEDLKKCGREETQLMCLQTLLSKYNQQYHKLFKDIPLEEVVLKVCSCALQRDLLLQGRLYISPNWLCFHASLFGKDIKVVIPVVSVQMIKKHKMARLLPNGLTITTTTSQKYVFVSLLSRDSVYDMLRRVCTHLQPSSKKSLSVREFPEEPECESLEVLIPEMKWRKVCPASRSLSLQDNIPCIPRASMDSTDSFFPSRKPTGSENADCEEEKLEEEPKSNGELRLWDYRLLKVFFVLICFLVMSSSYLAFRISRLEQQLCSLNWGSSVPGHR